MPMMRTVSSSCRLLSASTFERWRRGESNAREAMSGRLPWGKSGSCSGFFSMSPGDRALESLGYPQHGYTLRVDETVRMRLLAAAVTIRVAAGDLAGATAARDELTEAVGVYHSDGFRAVAACAQESCTRLMGATTTPNRFFERACRNGSSTARPMRQH